MKRSKKARKITVHVLCLIVAAAVSLIALSGRSHAFVIYDWVGFCQVRCTGKATAVLTLADTYKPGEAATAADFVRISYASDAARWEIKRSDTLSALHATLPVTAGPANVEIIEVDSPGVVGRGPGGIVTDTAGGWGAGLECDDVGRKEVQGRGRSERLDAPRPGSRTFGLRPTARLDLESARRLGDRMTISCRGLQCHR